MEKIKLKKQKFIDYCIKKEKYIPKLPDIKQNKNIEAILIETRKLEHLPFIIKNAIYNLGSNVSFTIICGNQNFDFIKNIKEEIQRDIKIINLGKNSLTREEYSLMLMDYNFWVQFYGEKLLIYQEDSIIFKKLDQKYLSYDYIGAPFENREVGNGGLSLRSKKLMIDICFKFFDKYYSKMKNNIELINNNKNLLNNMNYPYNRNLRMIYLMEKNILEDLNITNIMRKYNLGILPTFDIAREFSVEKFYHPYPFGGHSFWFCIFDFIPWLNMNLNY